MNLSDMAHEIERRRPGTLPKSISIEEEHLWVCGADDGWAVRLHDDLAHAILRDAMVMAIGASRITPHHDGWIIPVQTTHYSSDTTTTFRYWFDREHGNCPTRSLFAAFCAVYPKVKP